MCDYSLCPTPEQRAALREGLTMQTLEDISEDTMGIGLSDIRQHGAKQNPFRLLHTIIWGCIPEDANVTNVYEGGLVYPYQDSGDTVTSYRSRLSMMINRVEVSIHYADYRQDVGSVGEKVCLTASAFIDELCDQCNAIAPRY